VRGIQLVQLRLLCCLSVPIGLTLTDFGLFPSPPLSPMFPPMNPARALHLRPKISQPFLLFRYKPSPVPPIAISRLSPIRAMSEYKLKNVTSLSLQPGDKQEVELEGIEGAKVLLVNAAGKIQAVGPKCTHYGAPLVKGVLTKSGRLTCPWHGG
jgi:hypothetical protein